MIIKEFIDTTKKNLEYFQDVDRYKNVHTAMIRTLNNFKKYEK